MPSIHAIHKMEPQHLTDELRLLTANSGEPNGEIVLDFSSVERLFPCDLVALEALSKEAQSKGIKMLLCGVAVHVYKVLKVARLSSHFQFVN